MIRVEPRRSDTSQKGVAVVGADDVTIWNDDEAARLATLKAFNILDTKPEQSFDKITKLAANLFGVPVALVTFIDDHRQWFKAAIGTTVTEVPREIAFCTHTVASGKPLVVLDAHADLRFKNNPMVVGAPGIRFNVSVPLRAPNGTIPGTICIVDSVPHEDFTDREIGLLSDLADIVMTELMLKQALSEKDTALADRNLAHLLLDDALEFSEVTIWRLDLRTEAVIWRGATEQVWNNSAATLATLDAVFAAIHPDDRERVSDDLQAARISPRGYRSEFRIVLADGSERWLAGRGNFETGPEGDFMSGLNYDITPRKQQERYKELLMQEVGHRMRNLFASINAIILLTRSSATSVADYVGRLTERMAALNRAQNVLFAADEVSCTLSDLLDDIQNVYPRISWSGDDVALPEAAVVALSLIFNELSTNAVKYGSLAAEAGTVSITSCVTSGPSSQSAVELVWKEAGGSAVTAPPSSTGFGTKLIDLSIEDTLRGKITREWEIGGMTCALRFSCEPVLASALS